MIGPGDSGWPRPWASFLDENGVELQRLPVAWVTGHKVLTNDWTAFREDAVRAHDGRLCAVCGERMEGTIVLGRSRDLGKHTSGPGCHARCAALAVRSCPHLAGLVGVVAWAYDGPTNGYTVDELEHALPYLATVDQIYTVDLAVKHNARPLDRAALKALAKRDPLGIGSRP